MSLTLYQIADEYLRDLDRLNEADLDDQTFADTLESLGGELEVKATNVAMFIRNLEANADAIKAAEAAMYARRKALENKVERIKTYLLDNMMRTGITKIECPYFKLSVVDNPESVVIDSLTAVPAEFMRQPEPPPPAPDKVALKEALKAGKVIDGIRLERKKSLRIK